MSKLKENRFLDSVFKALRSVIISLILFAVINTGKIAFIGYREVLIFIAAFAILLKTKIHPIAIIEGFGIIRTIIY